MKVISKLIRLSLFLMAVFVILFFGTLIYLKPQWQSKATSNKMNLLAESIKSTPQADWSFFLLYQRLYPENLKQNYLSSKLLNGRSSICSRAAFYSITNITSMTIPERISFFHELESRVSQVQCFNCFIKEYDFLNQALGLDEAAEIYFQKKTEDLTLQEQLTFIVMLRNSSYFNPTRRPDEVHTEVVKLKNKLSQSTN